MRQKKDNKIYIIKTVREDMAVEQRSSNRKHTREVAGEDIAVEVMVERKGGVSVITDLDSMNTELVGIAGEVKEGIEVIKDLMYSIRILLTKQERLVDVLHVIVPCTGKMTAHTSRCLLKNWYKNVTWIHFLAKLFLVPC